MQIPTSIQLCGMTIETVFLDEPVAPGAIGYAEYAELKIYICTSISPADLTMQSYVHEAIHFMLWIMNRYELREDEPFVDQLAHLVYQAMKTAEY